MTGALVAALREVPAQLGAFYRDLASGRSWGWNADNDFPAASVIKIPILLAVYREAQRGNVQLDTRLEVLFQHHVGGAGVLFELHDGITVTIEDLCRLMIVVSDNVASNLLLELVGAPSVQALMDEFGMGKTVLGRKFMDPPRPGADNRTSAWDMGRCLQALQRGEILDKTHTNSALAILRRQQYREKIPLLLPPELPIAHKTGELDGVRHDVGLVEVPGRPYVLSLLTQKGGPAYEVDLALARISRMIYEIHVEGAP